MDHISLRKFTAIDAAGNVALYVAALEAFDAIPQLQELKAIERQQARFDPGAKVLDVGCGFGLETLRIAARVQPGGMVTGLDKSADFIAEARRRASAAGLAIDFRTGDAVALPFADAAFDAVRAERLLIYLKDWQRAVAEMKRVARPGGSISIIEPDFGSTTINLPDRAAVRRATAHEADTAVVMSWLPGPLLAYLRSLGLKDLAMATRVVEFPQDLGSTYFSDVGRHAHADGALSDAELEAWLASIAGLRERGELFGTVGYFLFTARV